MRTVAVTTLSNKGVCNAEKINEQLIEKYKRIIICILDNGCKLTHSKIIRQLCEIPDYSDEIKGIDGNLRKEMYDFCINKRDELGNRKYPYAQGYDFYGKQNKIIQDIRCFF